MNNIVLFATDDTGGAGKAALRIVKALNRSGRNCKMLVKNKLTNDKDVIRIHATTKFGYQQRIKNVIDKRNLRNIKLDNEYYFGYKYDDIIYSDIVKFLDFIPDTIIVTWISWFISPQTIQEFAAYYNSAIVVCPMDMSPFTGGCHYAWDCKGYQEDCSNCPAILSAEHKYVAINRLEEKKNYWTGSNIEFWACSNSIYNELAASSLARGKEIKKLFIPIDESIYNSKNRIIAKNIFNISSSTKVILFGSSFSYEKRKGIELFIKSLNQLYNKISFKEQSEIKVVIAGRKDDVSIKYDIPFGVISVDFITDDLLLSHLYQAANVLVSPTVQDSGPMMLNEAQMCGLPVVAFKIGVAPDLIINGVNGYLCDIGETEQMAVGIENILFGKLGASNTEIAGLAFHKTSFNAFSSFVDDSHIETVV